MDLDAATPVDRDSPRPQAARNALKAAGNLTHLADRTKNVGTIVKCRQFYFGEALKFLHAASLLETCSNENTNGGEMIQSMQVYNTTAKLCEFCALKYEKSNHMATAALAYKCMEVAHLRVVYFSHNSPNKYQHELQPALQMVPGESRSADGDNLNHPEQRRGCIGQKYHLSSCDKTPCQCRT